MRPAPEKSTERSNRDYLTWLALFACTLLAYSPALHGGFLWDDDGHLCKESLRSFHGLWRIWTELGATQQYYPVLHSAFWLEWHLWGEAVLGYHLVNVFLHATSACLVALLVRRLKLPGAWLARFIFALHPVCVESVAWISEQKNTLSTVFALGAAITYLRFDEERTKKRYSIASALFVLALLSKTVTAMVPAALVVVAWWRHGRVRWREDVLPLLPWLALGAAAGLTTAWVERTFIGATGEDFMLTLGERGMLPARILLFYLWKLVCPLNLIFIYPRWTPDPTAPWQYIFPLILVAALVFFWWRRSKERATIAGLLVYAILLFPALGFVNVYPFRYSFVADHFQYLASLAIVIPFAADLAPTSTSQVWRKVLAIVVVLTLGILSWQQAHLYRDAETLYRETIARNPQSWLAYNNLGNIRDTGPERHDEILALYRKALELAPDNPEPHINLASTLSRRPDTLPEAIEHWEITLKKKPAFADGHNNLGVLLTRVPNRLEDAISHFETAVRLQPNFTAAHSNLGTALAKVPGRLPDAIRHYRIAHDLAPNAETCFNLANALAKTPASHAEAIALYEDALKAKPDYAEAHCNLAVLLAQIPERREEAVRHYEAALRIHPEWDFVQRALDRLKQQNTR
ncbi:MAG: tetratricopeptide repeat protein [Nibricoccus sp.]